MAIVHTRSHHHLILHCQRYSCLRRAGVLDWRSFRHSDVLPPDGLHVALRQLEYQGSHSSLAFPGRLQHFHPGGWLFPPGLRNLWRDRRHHQCVQRVRRISGLVLRRQLELCLSIHPEVMWQLATLRYT